MTIYTVLHLIISLICIIGLYRSWQMLKNYPSAIEFAKWPLSLLVVLLVCSVVTIVDLEFIDIASNAVLNILAEVQLMYSAIVAAFCMPYLVRVTRE